MSKLKIYSIHKPETETIIETVGTDIEFFSGYMVIYNHQTPVAYIPGNNIITIREHNSNSSGFEYFQRKT